MNNHKNNIAILLATYNGEEFLKEQLDSLFSQTFNDFIIYAKDDCSTDSTLDILERYKNKYPEKLHVFKSNSNSGSAKYTFFDLLMQVDADYYFLCDQDDVWDPDKVEISLKKLFEAEKESESNIPVLLHSDARIVDEKLNLIDDSLGKRLQINFERDEFHQLLSQNIITGCTVLFNRELKNLLNKMPTAFLMHDWWLGITAAAFGQIVFLNKVTLNYRQHSDNSIGASEVKSFSYRIKKFFGGQEAKKAIQDTYEQAEEFYNTYENKLSMKQKEILDNYLAIKNSHKIKRIFMLITNDFVKYPFVRGLGHLWFV